MVVGLPAAGTESVWPWTPEETGAEGTEAALTGADEAGTPEAGAEGAEAGAEGTEAALTGADEAGAEGTEAAPAGAEETGAAGTEAEPAGAEETGTEAAPAGAEVAGAVASLSSTGQTVVEMATIWVTTCSCVCSAAGQSVTDGAHLVMVLSWVA